MKTLTLLFTLLFSMNALAQNEKTKTSIDTNLIRLIEIVKVNFDKPGSYPKKTLAKAQWAGFAAKWNNAKPMGADKYKMTYYVYVYLKDGKKRQFTINGQKIQEHDWLTFDIEDKLYFDRVWNAIK